MKKMLMHWIKRLKNIGRYHNGRSFLRDLYVFIKVWRKGFYVTFYDSGDDFQRTCLNHDRQGRIVDVDYYKQWKSYGAFCNGICKKWK
tara:strand:+ start:630 stop:893 length:264 start_codon:yes stop_codon:yes gene_type:complete